jgi:hypothetical protein
MYAEYDDDKELNIKISSDDICFCCAFKDDCPLIGALINGLVVPTYNDLNIQRCGLYCPGIEEDSLFIESFLDRVRVALRILLTGAY